VQWQVLADTCFGAAGGVGKVPIDEALVGLRALAFKFTYRSGYVYCHTLTPPTKWGYVLVPTIFGLACFLSYHFQLFRTRWSTICCESERGYC
jgi:hypothetical protein